MEPLIICKNIHKSFGEGSTRTTALSGVNFSVNRKEIRLLMGPSGSGKTTLLSIIAGILTQDIGECLLSGKDINHLPDQEKTDYRGMYIGFVFQIFNLIPTLTCMENVAIPLLIQKVPLKEALERARSLLNDVGVFDKATSFPNKLSGGQQQRVAIARAIIHSPALIICDEPTSFLDLITGNKIMTLLKELVTKKDLTLVVVTHDPRIMPFADKIDYLEDGKIVS
ncbi:MAG: ABC transporter ATP-binding protein [Chlamydiae bacterium]|nr:ABC transporter ATP-binding protein [Chlamydiota bacterium]